MVWLAVKLLRKSRYTVGPQARARCMYLWRGAFVNTQRLVSLQGVIASVRQSSDISARNDLRIVEKVVEQQKAKASDRLTQTSGYGSHA